MRICFFYSKVVPEAIEALPLYSVEMVFTGDSDTAYWEAVKERWGTDDLFFVEHDIVARPGVFAELRHCPHPWCTIPYNGLKSSLGCTRFRREASVYAPADAIQSAPMAVWPVPGLMVHADFACNTCKTSVCWRHLDLKIASAMFLTAKLQPHIHYPEVRHIK